MTTFMPASLKARAIPNPMPLSPPVMKATLPSTSFMGVGTTGQSFGADSTAVADRDTRTAAEAPAAASAVPPRNWRRARPDFVNEGFCDLFDIRAPGKVAGGRDRL